MSAGKYTCTYCDGDHADRCVNLACPIGYHNVLSTNPDECRDAHNPLDALLMKKFGLGVVSAQENIGPALRKTAGERFAAGKDDEAKVLRHLAETFEKAADTARREHSRKYSKESS